MSGQGGSGDAEKGRRAKQAGYARLHRWRQAKGIVRPSFDIQQTWKDALLEEAIALGIVAIPAGGELYVLGPRGRGWRSDKPLEEREVISLVLERTMPLCVHAIREWRKRRRRRPRECVSTNATKS